jgi:hypothetical protein
MSLTAAQRGWGDPAAPTFEETIRAACVLVKAGGISVRLHRDVADIFRYLNTGLARTYNLAGYADDYGLAIRPIRGYEAEWEATHDPKYLSNHSFGLAEDLDSSINPMTSDLKAQHEFIRAVVDPLLAPFKGRLVWGGEYASARKDYMHFEYKGTRQQAVEDSALARRHLSPTTVQGDPDMLIFHSPSHSYARVPGWVKLDPKTVKLYKGVMVVECTDAEWTAVQKQETAK